MFGDDYGDDFDSVFEADYEDYRDDLLEWENEQVFQDTVAEMDDGNEVDILPDEDAMCDLVWETDGDSYCGE